LRWFMGGGGRVDIDYCRELDIIGEPAPCILKESGAQTVDRRL
jgi:hypothetical protein